MKVIALLAVLLTLLTGQALAKDKKPAAQRHAAPPATKSAAKPASAQQVTFTTTDGFILKGTLYPGRPGAPIILLLHKLGSNRSEFTALAKLLQERGFNTLEYDARGHGESTATKDGRNLTYETFSTADFENMTLDIDAALKFLRGEKKIKNAPVGIVGASIQSSTGLLYASKHPEVRALVMLSPGLSYHDIDTVGPMKVYGPRAVFIAASIEDSYSYKSAKELYETARGPKKKEILSDAGHGVDMFRKEVGLPGKISDWLMANLK
jgi:pimeloyl-ACP methyl ester carboxylesterase